MWLPVISSGRTQVAQMENERIILVIPAIWPFLHRIKNLKCPAAAKHETSIEQHYIVKT